MIPPWFQGVAVITAVGCGLIAGTFFAFSVFIMGALARLPVPQGIEAMQSINRTVLNPLFLGVFLGTALLSFVIAFASLYLGLGREIRDVRHAAQIYFFGTFLLTLLGNVPLNNMLDKVDPENGADEWARYLREWTRWNHLRTVAATVALALFLVGLLQLPAGR